MAANWLVFDGDDITNDIPYALEELEARTNELRVTFIGAAAPASPEEGWWWTDNTASPYKTYQYLKIAGGAAAWVFMGPMEKLPGSINADPDIANGRAAPFEYLGLRVENVAALPASVAGNAGLLDYLDGDGEVYVSDQPVSGGWKGLLSVKKEGSYDSVELDLAGDVGNDGANPPTKAAKSGIEGWLFDAVAETRTFAFRVPSNWIGTSDLRFRLYQLLNGAEGAGDDIEWEGTLVAMTPGADKASATETVLVDSVKDIGADAEAIAEGGLHFNDFVLDYNDGDNPIAAGDIVRLTLNRKTVGGAGKVAGTIAVWGELHYIQTVRHERA